MPEKSRNREQSLIAKGRARILGTGNFLTSEELTTRFPNESTLSRAVLEAWEEEHRIFSIKHDGQVLYPSYAFSSDGEVLSGLKDVILVLNSRMDGWRLALWFGSSNSFLGGAQPCEGLCSNPDSVISAAVNEAQGAQHG